MLKKNQRLSKNQVSWVQRKGARFSDGFFYIKFCLNKITFCRYSVVVSKKIAARAVDRNSLRRQLYTIIRNLGDAPSHLDYIITVQPALLPLDFATKTVKLTEALQKIASQSP